MRTRAFTLAISAVGLAGVAQARPSLTTDDLDFELFDILGAELAPMPTPILEAPSIASALAKELNGLLKQFPEVLEQWSVYPDTAFNPKDPDAVMSVPLPQTVKAMTLQEMVQFCAGECATEDDCKAFEVNLEKNTCRMSTSRCATNMKMQARTAVFVSKLDFYDLIHNATAEPATDYVQLGGVFPVGTPMSKVNVMENCTLGDMSAERVAAHCGALCDDDPDCEGFQLGWNMGTCVFFDEFDDTEKFIVDAGSATYLPDLYLPTCKPDEFIGFWSVQAAPAPLGCVKKLKEKEECKRKNKDVLVNVQGGNACGQGLACVTDETACPNMGACCLVVKDGDKPDM
eukprot:comp12549_c0_seq1/m.7543 comp12549_c0_seq1/g.7543  ORF comp12549_c0_seq1/g.7543 comp12549_c0_seq1/m.7543 type:complete len:344 (-) comp12549_c0_seq1:447-1478(-)